MLKERKRRANVGVGLGVLVQFGASPLAAPASTALLLVGRAQFIRGRVEYARTKGHSPWFGALALLSLLGFIGLASEPDRHPERPGAA